MCLGVDGARAADAGNRAGTDRDEVGAGKEQAWDMERRGTPLEAGVRRGRPNASTVHTSGR
jgi:hypothetical protein